MVRMVTEGDAPRNGRRRRNDGNAPINGAAFRCARLSAMCAAMLTAILLAYDAPAQPLRGDAVARSLASLVEACVQGLVADAALVGAPERGLDRIADDAGYRAYYLVKPQCVPPAGCRGYAGLRAGPRWRSKTPGCTARRAARSRSAMSS